MTDPNIIDFIEAYFQCDLDHGLVEDLRSRRVTFDKDDFNVGYSAWRQNVPIPTRGNSDYNYHWGLRFEPVRIPPAKPKYHLRPYLPVETRPTPGKPNTGYFVFDRTEDAFWQTVDAIKHHLLYCHSVAIENPMSIWMRDKGDALALSRASNLQGGVLGWKFNSSLILARWASFLVHMRPLIESGALIIVEEVARDPFVLQPIRHTDTEAIEIAARELGLTTVELASAVRKLDLLIKARSRGLGNLDIDLSDRHVERLARRLLEQEGDVGGPLKTGEAAALSTLIAAELPALGQLSIDDLVAVRRSGEEFENWRRGIEGIARRIGSENLGELPASEKAYELSRRFRGEVLDLQRTLVANISGADTHVPLRKTVLKFAVGAAVGGLVGWPLGLGFTAAELLRDFAKTIVEALVDTKGQSESSAVTQRALAGLFVAFSNE